MARPGHLHPQDLTGGRAPRRRHRLRRGPEANPLAIPWHAEMRVEEGHPEGLPRHIEQAPDVPGTPGYPLVAGVRDLPDRVRRIAPHQGSAQGVDAVAAGRDENAEQEHHAEAARDLPCRRAASRPGLAPDHGVRAPNTSPLVPDGSREKPEDQPGDSPAYPGLPRLAHIPRREELRHRLTHPIQHDPRRHRTRKAIRTGTIGQ